MIANLRGSILQKKPPEVVVDVSGVGYLVVLSMLSYFELPALNAQVSLKIHAYYREDQQILYGFIDEEERSLFKLLIKVNGIGPKSALGILSKVRPYEFVNLVREQDAVGLSKMPGIGKKTAERLIIELRESLNSEEAFSLSIKGDELTASGANSSPTVREDAITAMISLGFNKSSAEKIIGKLIKPDLSVEELLRLALKQKA